MRFMRITAARQAFGPHVSNGKSLERYVSFSYSAPVLEVRDKEQMKSNNGGPGCIIEIHFSHASQGTGRYEVPDATAAQVVAKLEKLAAPAAPKTTASLGVLPVGMMG